MIVHISKAKIILCAVAVVVILLAGCSKGAEEIDLVNNEVHKKQAFDQILNHPELQKEFLMQLKNNRESMSRLMKDREFTGELFSRENMKYIWDQNPGIDSAVIDNVTTRMHTDTNFMEEFHRRMESGTPSGFR